MADNIRYMENIQDIFHQLADMKLTKAQRQKVAAMVGAAVVNGYAAGQAGDYEAVETALWLRNETQK